MATLVPFHPFHRQDVIVPTMKSTAITGTAGLLAASLQATLTKRNIGMLGTFTVYGGTIGTLAAMGGVFEFVRLASANLREKNDPWNQTIGGFFSGAVMGFRYRTISAVLGHGSVLAIVMCAFDFTGGSLLGYKQGAGYVDEYARKEELRANKRRPITETLEELGEGRGIYGPGYDERRRERIKQRYGIDVPASR